MNVLYSFRFIFLFVFLVSFYSLLYYEEMTDWVLNKDPDYYLKSDNLFVDLFINKPFLRMVCVASGIMIMRLVTFCIFQK